jgi:putative endopeptidase
VFGLWVAQDLDDPSRYAPFLLQGGLTMPDRDYYLVDSPHMAEIRSHYRAHIAASSSWRVSPTLSARPSAFMRSSSRLRARTPSRADTEDVKRGDNHWSRAQLNSSAPGLDWNAFLAGAGLATPAAVHRMAAGRAQRTSALVASEPLASWKAYLQYHAIEHNARFLPRALVAEHFAFYGNALQGTPQLRERWKRAVSYTSAALGEAVGKLYVTHYFLPADKAAIEDMVRQSDRRLCDPHRPLAWMAPQTKVEAKAKLAALKVGIGYPDRWRDYSA